MLLLVLGALVAPSPAHSIAWRCFDLAYPGVPAEAAAMYPHLLALEGTDSGAVISSAGRGDHGFWGMFRNVGSRWVRRGNDSLSVSFDNGFTGVVFDFALRGDSLLGRGVIHYDFGDPKDHPRFAIAGRARPCVASDLEGPERDPEALQFARDQAEWQQYEDSERRRISELAISYSGTWRFVIEVPGSAPAVLFGRTAAHPGNIDRDIMYRDTTEHEIFERRPAEGFRVGMLVARDTLQLAGTDLQNDRPPTLAAGFAVREEPLVRSADSTVWEAQVDLVQALSRLASSEGVRHSPWLKASKAVNEVWWDRLPGRIEGAIVVRRDGTASYRASTERGGKVVLRIHGERVGTGTLSTP